MLLTDQSTTFDNCSQCWSWAVSARLRSENVLIGGAAPGRIMDGDDVVPASLQLAGDQARVHLVEQEPQETACRARQTR